MTGTREISRRISTTTDDARPIAPILIQVPTVRIVPHRTMMGPGPKPRRRLKREVRLVGFAILLVALPSAGYLAGSRWSAPDLGRAEEPFAPSVTLSFEPIAQVAARPTRDGSEKKPVELESTLLPVDGSEDPPHDEGR